MPAAGPHNNADVMFATMMIPHHQQAIQMSNLILTKDGINIQVVDLARQIKTAQGPEITRMSGWLAGWGRNPSPAAGMGHMLDALEKASGDEAARLFLSEMITHHQSAINMARQETARGQNPEATQLAQDIIDPQQAEITIMDQLLEQL